MPQYGLLWSYYASKLTCKYEPLGTLTCDWVIIDLHQRIKKKLHNELVNNLCFVLERIYWGEKKL